MLGSFTDNGFKLRCNDWKLRFHALLCASVGWQHYVVSEMEKNISLCAYSNWQGDTNILVLVTSPNCSYLGIIIHSCM